MNMEIKNSPIKPPKKYSPEQSPKSLPAARHSSGFRSIGFNKKPYRILTESLGNQGLKNLIESKSKASSSIMKASSSISKHSESQGE